MTSSTRAPRGAATSPAPRSGTRRRLDPVLEDVLRRAYAREGRVIRGVATTRVLQLVEMQLAHLVHRGRYDRYALSPAGEALAEELTRAVLARGAETSSPLPAEGRASEAHRAAVLDEVVDFLAGARGEATSLRLDLPGTARTPRGLVVRVERSGPSKLLVQLLGTPGGSR